MGELQKIQRALDLTDKIVDLLPEDIHEGLIILSMSVDQYAAENDLDSSMVWNIIHQAAIHTREQVGEYPRRSK